MNEHRADSRDPRIIHARRVPSNAETRDARAARWSPEIDLLIACARLHLAPADAERAHAAIAAGIVPARLLQLAQRHGLLQLLNLHVARGSVQVSDAIRSQLAKFADARATRNLILTRELILLLRLCAEHGIPVIPLKGLVLARQIYGDISLRRISDIDVLFRDEDISRVVQLLQGHGYQSADAALAHGDEVEQRNSHHVSVEHAQKEARLELHRYLLRPRARGRWDFDAIAPRLAPMTFMGHSVQAFTPEDLLVYLCEHGAEHAWIRLEWLASVAELVRSGQVRDWARVWQWAGELGTTRRVGAALVMANEWFGVDISAAQIASDRSMRAANEIVAHRLATEPLRARETPAERFRYQLRTDATLTAQLLRCWTTALTPSAADVEAVALPKVLFPLYAAVRPIRLAIRRLRKGL